jgi:hypothetical protein
MKYTLKITGAEMHITAQSLNDEEADAVRVYADDNEEDLLNINGEIDTETLPGYDAWNTNMWVLDKPSDDADASFVVEDANGELACEFELSDIKRVKKPASKPLLAMPGENGAENVLLCVSNSKGTVCDFTFESPQPPAPEDFTYVVGELVTPAGKGAFIDKVLFKGHELEFGYDSQDTDNIGITSQLFPIEGDEEDEEE